MDKNLTRAFICLRVSDEAIKEIARIQEVLSGYKFTGKMTELENLHLTLKFLGEIDNEKIEKVKEALKRVEFKAFEAKLSESGTFKINGNPKIVWIKIGGKETFELQKRVDDALEGLFKKEERFMSHLTIARIKYVKDKDNFLKYIENLGVKSINFKVDKFQLMKSELKSPGPVYTVIEEYPLN